MPCLNLLALFEGIATLQALDDLNSNASLLPGIRLNGLFMSSNSEIGRTFQAATSMCNSYPVPIIGIVGEYQTAFSSVIAYSTRYFSVSQVSDSESPFPFLLFRSCSSYVCCLRLALIDCLDAWD